MTKTFCDLCGKEIHSVNKITAHYRVAPTGSMQEEIFEICDECLSEYRRLIWAIEADFIYKKQQSKKQGDK